MKPITTALLVIQPGPLRNSLKSFLSTFPAIEVLAEARDMSVLWRLGRELRPDLIVIEAGLPGYGLDQERQLAVILKRLKDELPAARCLVLVENAEQHQAAEAAGADIVIFKGYRAPELVHCIEELLAPPAALADSAGAN